MAGIVALTAQRLLRPKGYGEVGHYRIGGLWDVMSQEPVHQGEASCNECHDDIVELHDKDIHFNVNCEDCHGPANLHVKYHSGDDDLIVTVEETKLPGARDFAILPVVHSVMMNDANVHEYTLRFIKEGFFISSDKRAPLAREDGRQ